MPTTSVSDFFKPTSASVRQLLSDYVGGYEIPSYQRPYRWKRADLARLFETVMACLDRSIHDDSVVSFIGAVISVNNVSQTHTHLPREPKQVIDGQQRLTSLIMTVAALDQALRRSEGNLAGIDQSVIDGLAGGEAALNWLKEQIAQTCDELFTCMFDARSFGDGEYKKLPKLVRSGVDHWSTYEAQARYCSPVANLIFQYILKRDDGGQMTTVPAPFYNVDPSAPGSSEDDRDVLNSRFADVRRLVNSLVVGDAEQLDLAVVLSVRSQILRGLFQVNDESLDSALKTMALQEPRVATALRLLLFSRFLLDRVVVTSINAADEAYAFDLFDSLNTTGQPLTAFETFLPLVVEKEGQERYPHTVSFVHMSQVSRFLNASNDPQSSTSQLLVSFLLAECGMRVSRRHNDQRQDLTKRFNAANGTDARRAMTQQLADSSVAFFEIYPKGELGLASDAGDELSLSSATRLALRYLSATNHSIVVAPIARYFVEVRKNRDQQSVDRLQRLVLAMCAFSALWRAAHGGTDGIDGQYRQLMEESLARCAAKTIHLERPLPTVDETVLALRQRLASSEHGNNIPFADATEWVERSWRRAIYSDQRELARFLSLLAAHHRVPDGSSGLTQNGVLSDSTNMLLPQRWDDERFATIEHIAPQSNSRGNWDVGIYGDPTVVHRLGNLSLLPLPINSFLGDMAWEEKRQVYLALSADSEAETRHLLSGLTMNGQQLSSESVDRLVDARLHLPLLAAVGSRTGDWDSDFIDLRSKHLYGQAWSVLSGWLSLNSPSESLLV